MTFCGNSLSRSLLRVKRTSAFALYMSAFDPKRTLSQQINDALRNLPLPDRMAALIRLLTKSRAQWMPSRHLFRRLW